MSNLRFVVLTRREGQSVHDSDKFATEEYKSTDDLLDAVEHYIMLQLEDEAINGTEYDDRNYDES